MNHLTQITIKLPATDDNFQSGFFKFFSNLGIIQNDCISFHASNENYIPKVTVTFSSETRVPSTEFLIGDEKQIVELSNKTGQEKSSPHSYEDIELNDFLNRMTGIQPTNLDHAGIDLPWFDGIHPEIIALRNLLKQSSLYYLFPSGEPWDFIMPGTIEEVSKHNDPDLTLVRRPKFEVVSLDKCSTPIIQFEFHVKVPYKQLLDMFPEGIGVDEVKCVWVYIKNDYGVDICMVVNEDLNNDWCEYFVGNRL